MLPIPTKEEIADAFNKGASVMFGLPTHVPTAHGHATLDIGRAAQKLPNPWNVHGTRRMNGVDVVICCNAYAYIISLNNVVSSNRQDNIFVMDALNAAPKESQRHSEYANDMRLKAGTHALKIRDAHIRALVMQAVDGWSAARSLGVLDDTSEGTLTKAPQSVNANILILTCPSTKRIYSHLVPQEFKKVRSARHWMMGLGPDDTPPDAET